VRLRFSRIMLLALVACPVSAQEPKGSPYFPLKSGWQWTYRTNDDQRVVLRLAGVEKVDDALCAILETRRPDGLAITEHVAVKADGIYRYKAMRLALEPPVCILKLPAKKTWKVEAKIGGDTLSGSCTLDETEVVVPKGKFQALRVTAGLERGKQKFTIITYFAPGFGMVKQEQDLAGKKITLELVDYEMGK
jgi:hypothetical protein